MIVNVVNVMNVNVIVKVTAHVLNLLTIELKIIPRNKKPRKAPAQKQVIKSPNNVFTLTATKT